MIEFYTTQMGRRFYENTMPELVKQLSDLNKNLKILNDKSATPSSENQPSVSYLPHSYVPLPVEDVHIAVGPEEIDAVIAAASESDICGSDQRRKLAIARGELHTLIDHLEEIYDESFTDERRKSMIADIRTVLAETSDTWSGEF